jgi:glycosyltransferase involved in cell wall biosynthesis
LKEKLHRSTFVILAHRVYPSIVDDFKKYLLDNKCGELWYIIHEFNTLETRRTFVEHYRNGEPVDTHYGLDYRFIPDPYVNIKDFLYSLYWMLFRVPGGVDVFIGLGGFNVLCGTLVQRIKRIKKVLFYTVDYVPLRFENHILNEIYHRIDRFELARADETWNVSPRMSEARQSLRGLPEARYPQHIVPIGLWFDQIPRYDFDEIDKTELIFIGGLFEKQGVQVALRAVPLILEKVPGFKFRIIGTGPYEDVLKKLAEELGISDKVIFEGGIPDQDVANEKLARAALAVAMYDKRIDDFSYFADPGKIKNYLAVGLPVLLTDLPHNAQEIDSKRCGKVLEYSEEALAGAVIELMTDEDLLREYRNNALEYARQFDWNVLLDSNLARLL